MSTSSIRTLAGLAGVAVITWTTAALAHVSAAGPAFAGRSHLMTFGVGHGCEGADTVSVEVRIPEAVTIVRAVPSAWGEAELVRNDADLVTSVAWTKPDARPADDQYYQFAIRYTVPDAPFTRLYFHAIQTCRTVEGEDLVAEWTASVEEAAAAAENEEVLESPSVWILPPRSPGWNKYEAEDAIEDLSIFDDAAIVWVDDAAYSSNPTTKELIAAEQDVEELTTIEAGAEIWVKY